MLEFLIKYEGLIVGMLVILCPFIAIAISNIIWKFRVKFLGHYKGYGFDLDEVNTSKHKKIIDFILDGQDTKNEICVLLKSVFKHDRKLYNTYLEDIKEGSK